MQSVLHITIRKSEKVEGDMKKLIILIILILAILCYIQNRQNEPTTDFYIEPINYTTVADKPQQAKEISRKLSVTAYGYCPCVKCCGKSNSITATGVRAKEGRTIAVDADLIPLGSTVIIDGHEYVAEDVGGGIKGNTVDIFHETHKSALEWGKRKIDIEVRE